MGLVPGQIMAQVVAYGDVTATIATGSFSAVQNEYSQMLLAS